MTTARTSDLWWKNAIVYCLDVETFFDWDGDGTGDLAGLTERIDYLAGIGISCLWLMPFQPVARTATTATTSRTTTAWTSGWARSETSSR